MHISSDEKYTQGLPAPLFIIPTYIPNFSQAIYQTSRRQNCPKIKMLLSEPEKTNAPVKQVIKYPEIKMPN